MYNKCYHGTAVFGKGSIPKDRSARFTGKPYDEDLQAYVFPYRNYYASGAPSTPTGYSDGINQRLWLSYLCVVSLKIGVFYVAIDTGLWV